MNKNLKIFLLVGFLSYYSFFVLFGLLVEQRTRYAHGYQAFDMAVVFGPFVALAFCGILYLAIFARRMLLSAASIRVVVVGAIVSAFLAVCCFAIVDRSLSEAIDRRVAGSPGDWMVPITAVVLTFFACYVGVRVATRRAR